MKAKTLSLAEAYERAKKLLEEKATRAKGNAVTLSVKELCGDGNGKPCGEALKRLCLETPGCWKSSNGKYTFPVRRGGTVA